MQKLYFVKNAFFPIIVIVVFTLQMSEGYAQTEACIPQTTSTNCISEHAIDIHFRYPKWIEDDSYILSVLQEHYFHQQALFWQNLQRTMGYGEMPLQAYLEIWVEEYWYGDSVVTFVIWQSDFILAAYPNSRIETYTFALNPTHQITLFDIFQDDTNVIYSLAPLMETYSAESDFYAELWQYSGGQYNSQNYENFALTDDKMIFFFPAFRMGPTNAGLIQVAIPLRDLDLILKPEFIPPS